MPELEEVPPRETIYVNNLNERINLEEIKKSLYSCFSQFGPILEIVALKTLRMRGQAFVVFRDIESATQAVRQMQGFPFYDKPMKIAYAKTKSDASAKLDGTFELHDKAERAAKRKADREAREAAISDKKAAKAAGNGDEAQSGGTSVNEMMLSMLFQQFPGYKEVRLVPGKSGIAFVEFETEMQSGVAMSGLQNFKITPTNLMQISFAKR